MARFKLTIEYDGTGMAGWQRQDDCPTIQSHLESAVKKFCGEDSEVIGAGRTDAGVHAYAQVAHVNIRKEVIAYKVMHGINYHLTEQTPQIIVTAAEQVADDFHARFSATKRSYFYRIINRRARLALARNRAWHIPENLDVLAMQEAAKLLVGHHDFTTFRSSICQAKSPVKTLDALQVVRQGEEIHIYASAPSFLHHQVRNLAGVLRLAGNKKWSSADVQEALEARDRSRGGETAPAYGLYLVTVYY